MSQPHLQNCLDRDSNIKKKEIIFKGSSKLITENSLLCPCTVQLVLYFCFHEFFFLCSSRLLVISFAIIFILQFFFFMFFPFCQMHDHQYLPIGYVICSGVALLIHQYLPNEHWLNFFMNLQCYLEFSLTGLLDYHNDKSKVQSQIGFESSMCMHTCA